MQVIFLQDVKNVAKRGQTKNVPDGYARNFLLARKLAVQATPVEMAKIKVQEDQKKIQLALEKQEIQKLADNIAGKIIQIKARAKDRKLFGSITPKEIAQELRKLGFAVPEKAFPSEHIRELGEHKLKITFEHGIIATITVNVEQTQ